MAKSLDQNTLQWGWDYLDHVLDNETVSNFEDWYSYYQSNPDDCTRPLPPSESIREAFYEMIRRVGTLYPVETKPSPKTKLPEGSTLQHWTDSEGEKLLNLLRHYFPAIQYEDSEMEGGDTVEELCRLYKDLGGKKLPGEGKPEDTEE